MELDMAKFEELKEISGADFIDELVDTFLEDAPRLVNEMKSALRTNDAEAFRRAAHSLKSNSATFGADHLSALARDMEMMGKDRRLPESESSLQTLEQTLQAVDAELRGLRA